MMPFITTATEWKIIPDQSKIEFATTQNSSKVLGSFKKFFGKINFDPTQLKTSTIEIEVDIASVASSTTGAALTLQAIDWFSAKDSPKAIFTANKFTKISDKKYTAEGNLTIKGKAVATILEFTLEEYSAAKAKVVGSTTIKRSDFAIGAKDPANAHGIADSVVVSFAVNAIK